MRPRMSAAYTWPRRSPTGSRVSDCRVLLEWKTIWMSVGSPEFLRLNTGWNAEPNAPSPEVAVDGNSVELQFFLSLGLYRGQERRRGIITFGDCSRWRLGLTND